MPAVVKRRALQRGVVLVAAAGLLAGVATGAGTAAASAAAAPGHRAATPIRHLVVIFQENVSFDHYFGTYPNAANTDGSAFTAKPGTPAASGNAWRSRAPSITAPGC